MFAIELGHPTMYGEGPIVANAVQRTRDMHNEPQAKIRSIKGVRMLGNALKLLLRGCFEHQVSYLHGSSFNSYLTLGTYTRTVPQLQSS